MALFGPARPPGFLTRQLRGLVDLRFLVKACITLAMLGLVIIPSLADMVNAVAKEARSDQGSCRILNVIDGDTVTLMCEESGIGRAQLAGYDTPEKYAPKCFGEFVAAEKAGWGLRTLIQKADRMGIEHLGLDTEGRETVRLTLDGLDVASAMIRAGHGRRFGGGLRGSWC